MTSRECPWCGGKLVLRNITDSKLYWSDNDCGYREVTTDKEKYNYEQHRMEKVDMIVLEVHKPKPRQVRLE